MTLPVVLFVATCFSTYVAWWFFNSWRYTHPSQNVEHAYDGLFYTGALLAILVTHEFGHFLQAVRYHIPASFPYFIPMPFTPLGTLGAIIGMRGMEADRKELFDIGLTGPLAGLVVALPVAWVGLAMSEPVAAPQYPSFFQNPLLWDLMLYSIHGREAFQPDVIVPLNPLSMAGWVGLFLTGFNMLPISQLDGGHVSYALLGKKSYWLARLMLLAGIVFVVYFQYYAWMLAIILLFLIGPTHPPTADDNVPLGRSRYVIGFLSLLIPILCFTPTPINPAYLQ